jgi:hypothetical protein
VSEPAEDRVTVYLSELRDAPPEPSGELGPSIVRRARWQEAVRTPVRAVGALGAALGDGLALVLGLRRREDP